MTGCQVTPPPDTELASKPAAVEVLALVPTMATRESPAPTEPGRVTLHDVWPENAPWFSCTTLGAGGLAGPAFSTSTVTSNAADGDQLKFADGADAVPTFQ